MLHSTVTRLLSKAIAVAVAVAILAGPIAASAHERPVIRAMTYNIRLDTERDGQNAWPHRRDSIYALIRFYAPDLMGMQEVLPHQRNQLAENLADYAFVGVGRDDGAEGGEFSPLVYRRARFELQDSGTFWLSRTPDQPSLGWDAGYPRIVTWARLRSIPEGAPILALSTHWDHVGVRARANSARLIKSWLAQHRRAGETVVLMGDLNAPPTEPSYLRLTSEGGVTLRDARSLSTSPPFGPSGTFNGFDIMRADAHPIDYILVGVGVDVVRHAVITHHNAGRLPSDHYPVFADLVLPATPHP